MVNNTLQYILFIYGKIMIHLGFSGGSDSQ